MKTGTVGWAGNSGFHCLNLAVQMQVGRIVLVGYDMTTQYGLHWHGPHANGLNNPTERNIDRWRRCIDAVAEQIESLGIEVFNTSPISALQNYRKATFEEAISC